MNPQWEEGFRRSCTRWRRPALLVSLAVACALGPGACGTSQDSPGADTPTDPANTLGEGKGDSFGSEDPELALSAMEVLPDQPGLLDVVSNPSGEWFTRLIGPAGDVFLTSTIQQQKVSAINNILSVEENGVLLERYKVTPIGTDECSFELRAGNNHVIANGPVFRGCDQAEARIQETRDLVAGVVRFKASVSQGARFQLWREPSDRQWYFDMRAEDDRVLLESQAYTGRTNAVTGIESVRSNGKLPERYEIGTDDDGSLVIRLMASNGREIATSGPYEAEEDANAVIEESVGLLVSERVGNPW